jgi:aspartyl-tRNA(Asn)/glutamyl-tRNA(Gln) amidotransferase subunit B
MRSKEDSHDYRYFTDPDLVPLIIDSSKISEIKTTLPELAAQKAARFVQEYKLPEYDADILTVDKELADYFEAAIKEHNQPKKISNWIMTDLLRELKNAGKSINESPISAIQIAKMVKLIDEGVISGKIGKTVFEEMFASSKDPEVIVKEKGLVQVSDTGAIEKVIEEVMTNNPDQLEQYRSGKDKLFGFFVGQVMKEMKGQGNPQVVNKILKEKLKG